MNRDWRDIGLALALGAGVALVAPGATAATGEQSAQPLEEIVVTARKRKENLQDVGFAVSALSQTEIESTFARDIRDLALMAPNLIIDDTSQGPGGNAALYIRGIGVADVEKNFDPAVGVVIDGVFIGANSGALLRSIDLTSVEVLRGPQGTLFGRNTIGGLINLERSRPTGEFGMKARAGYGDYDTFYIDGIVNFGLGEMLSAKLSFAKNDQREGYFKNTNTGDDNGQIDYQSYGINLLFEPVDNFELEYTYQDEETDQDTPPLLNVAQFETASFCSDFDLCAESLKTPSSGDRFRVNTLGFYPAVPGSDEITFSAVADLIPIDLDATFDTESHIFEAHWDINDAWRMDYIFGSYETEETILSNWTAEAVMMFGTSRPAEYEQDSHELRFTYDNDGALSFVGGAYYWESEYEIRLRSWITFAVPGVVLDIPQTTQQETESKALFFEGDYALTDQLTLTLGGRYTEDEKISRQFDNLATGPNHPEESWDEFTPRVGARYEISDELMVFGTFSKGYRSGGFNGRVDSDDAARQPYDPETVDNFEIGFKSQLLDGRMRFNGSAFLMKYDDKQEELQLPSSGATGQKTVVVNAADATIQGIELEAVALVTANLSLRANLGFLDSEYDEFSYTNVDGDLVDLSGLEFRRAPEWNGTLDATYEWPIGEGNAWVRGSYHFLGEHFVDVSNAPELENDTQHLIDLSVNYAVNGYRFSLYGRNLTDEDGYAHGFDVSGLWAYAIPRAPRTWGLEFSYSFDER